MSRLGHLAREKSCLRESGSLNKDEGKIMKMLKTGCWLALAVLLTGCWQKSVHSFCTEKDAVSEPKLIGTWTEDAEPEGNRTTWTFAALNDKRFGVVMQNKDEKYEFEGTLFKLGSERFLDLEGKTRSMSTIPSHHLLRVELGADLKIAMLNTEWVQKWLRANPDALAHIALVSTEHRENREKDELVLSADTKALQKFILAHKDDKEFFVEPVTMKK